MRWPGSRARPSLPARCTVSGLSIKRSTNQGNKTKAWHRRCVTAYDHVARDTAPLSARWACSSVPGEWERMRAMLWGGKDKRERAPENPRANGQQVIKRLLVPLKPWGPADRKCKTHQWHLLKTYSPAATQNWVHEILPFSKSKKNAEPSQQRSLTKPHPTWMQKMTNYELSLYVTVILTKKKLRDLMFRK